MDEPCSALDPIATAKIEELMNNLASSYTIIIVTHSMQQAGRVSQNTAFFHMGDLVETGETAKIFTQPDEQRTQDYITGDLDKMSEHISSQFENDILQINVNLTKMGGICEDNLKKQLKQLQKMIQSWLSIL